MPAKDWVLFCCFIVSAISLLGVIVGFLPPPFLALSCAAGLILVVFGG